MKAIYFDCFSGVSGDMILGGLLDLGLSIETLSNELSSLKVKNFEISARRVIKSNVAATKLDVQTGPEHQHRNYNEVEEIISGSALSLSIKQRAVNIFRRLGEAEASVHGSTLDKVHFHEVGAIDSIVDIVGACVGFQILSVQEFYASALNVGHGFAESAHGRLPVPAPATAELLKGIPVYSNQIGGELVTPTGAAIVSCLCKKFGELPKMRIEKIGYGAGTMDFKDAPNVLRLFLGEMAPETQSETSFSRSVVVVEANIDDMNPQIYGHLQDKLFDLGVLDVFTCPAQMKKNRPGILLSVVSSEELLEKVSSLLFQETTTIGLRHYAVQRKMLERQVEEIETELGKVKVKVSRLEGKIVNFSPEYEECRALANRHQMPYKWVQAKIIQEFMNLHATEMASQTFS